MAEIGKYVHLFCFALRLRNLIYMKSILNENTDNFRKSQVPAGFYYFFQQSYYRYKIQNGQNDRCGRSSVNITCEPKAS